MAKLRLDISRTTPLAVLGVFFIWCLVVVLSGLGMRVGPGWDFETTGQLGDSFGVLSALMSSFAAIFTFQTLNETRREREIAEREAKARAAEAASAKVLAETERQRSEERETKRLEAESRRDSEGTYFRLLDLRYQALGDLKAKFSDRILVGTDAAEQIVVSITRSLNTEYTKEDIQGIFDKSFKRNENDLAHYFRLTYHIVRFAHETFGRGAYGYVRLLRAQLSSSELTLIALNCALGEGRGKFSNLVERYSFLHNVPQDWRERFRLDEYFAPRAFDSQSTLEETKAWKKNKSN